MYMDCRPLPSLRDFGHVGVRIHLDINQQQQQLGLPEACS
jgi:hypothetical protein